MEQENKLTRFWNKINGRELLIILLIYAFSIAMYLLFAALQLPTHTIQMKIDDYIPFVPVFVIGYHFYYYTWFFSVWFTSFKSKKVFIRMCKVAFWSVVIASIFYTFFPVEMTRPVVTGTDIFSKMVRGIYKADVNSRTCFPSLHAVIGTVTALAAIKDKGGNILRRLLFIFFGVSMTLAATLIKQHYFIDIVTGSVLVILVDLFFDLLDKRRESKYEVVQ